MLLLLSITSLCEILFINKGLSTLTKKQNFIKFQNLISTEARKKHSYFFCMYYQIFDEYLGRSLNL